MTGEPRPGGPRRPGRDGGEVTRAVGPVYFHGGIAGLSPGECILPPAVTGTRPRQAGDDDHVHITTSRRYAVEYAAQYASEHDGQPGAVYEVEPDGPLRPGEYRGRRAPSDYWCAKASVLRLRELWVHGRVPDTTAVALAGRYQVPVGRWEGYAATAPVSLLAVG